MSNQFNAYAEYYNLFYAGKNYAAESKYVHNLIQDHKSNSVEILEFGCGSGGHARELQPYGYSMHGVDISHAMLKQAETLARTNPKNLNFSHGDLRTLALAKEFDVVLSLFHVMGYQNSNDDLARAFSSAYRHLKPGGLFIYDFWYGPTVLSEGPSTKVLQVADGKKQIMRISQPSLDLKRNICNVSYSIFVKSDNENYKKISEEHSMRYFFQNEFSQFEENKFECLGEFSWLTKNSLELGDWYGVRVCKKVTKKVGL